MTPTSTLRDQLVAHKLEPDDTEHTRGYNDGIDTSIELVDRAATEHAGATSTATTAKLGELRAAGRKTGGPAPYGWFVVSGDIVRTLVEVPSEQRAIAIVRRLRGDGQSWRAIAAALASQGIRSRLGGRFVPAQLRRMMISTREPTTPVGGELPVSAPPPGPRVSGKRRATKIAAPRRKPRR